MQYRARPTGWEVGLALRPAKNRYGPAWEALPGLVEEMDFRYLLPKAAVTEGDTWEVPPGRVVDLLFPGGSFAWKGERWDGASRLEAILLPGLLRELRDTSESLLEGSIRVTRTGESDGLVELQIDVDIELGEEYAVVDGLAAKFIQTLLNDDCLIVDTNHLDLSVRAKGRAHWNVKKGRMQSMELEGEADCQLELFADWGWGNASDVDFWLDMEMTGTFHNRVQVD